jgi:hypothetical protein
MPLAADLILLPGNESYEEKCSKIPFPPQPPAPKTQQQQSSPTFHSEVSL